MDDATEKQETKSDLAAPAVSKNKYRRGADSVLVDLNFDKALGEEYKSKTKKIRVIKEISKIQQKAHAPKQLIIIKSKRR